MSDPIPSGPPADPADPGASIPSLVEAYRHRRDALRAQMDGLSALQDDIRTAARREGREILEHARRDVRQTILEARQRLLALADEVQAALDHAGVRAGDDSGDRPDGRSAGPQVAGAEVLGDLHLDLGAILEWSEPDLDTLDNDVKALAAVLASPLDAQLVAFDPYEFPSEAVLLADAADMPTESAAVTPPVDPRPVAPPASPASSGARSASTVGPPAGSVEPSGRPQPDVRPVAPGQAAPAATEPRARSEPRHAGRPFDPPERERHPSGRPEPFDRPDASGRPPSSGRSGEFPAVPVATGSAGGATAAPQRATDLSALVTEIVARHAEGTPGDGLSQGGIPDPDDPPAARPSRPSRAEGLFAAAAMPVSRGSRLVGWLSARGHLLPIAVGLVVTLMVIASWFRESPDPDTVSLDEVALWSEGALGGDGGSAEPGGASPVRPGVAETPLRVEARREVWVQVTVDGRQEAGRTLRAGEVQSIPATREIVIRAGDAGALWVSLWGGAAEPLGPDGRVVTRSFPLGSSQGAPAGTGSRGPDGPTVADPTARSLVGVTGPTVDSAPSRQTMPSATTNANAGGTPTASGRTVQPPAGTPASRTANAPAPARDQVPPEALIVSAAEGWFESYYRRLPYDAFGTSHRPSVADGRQPDSRLPEGIWEVNRTFDDVQVQVVADTAIYSARMTEHGRAGEVSAAHASRVSQVWVRRGAGWQLMDVKLLSEPRP